MRIRTPLLLFVLTALLVTGCGGKQPQLEIMAPLPDTPHCRVAILPFSYQGDYPRGENIVYKAFFAEMGAVSGFDIVAEGDVAELYKQFQLYPKDRPNEEQMRILAERLRAETLIIGDVLYMAEQDADQGVSTDLGLTVHVYAGTTGKLVWSTYHRRRGQHYHNVLYSGRVNTMSGLARRMSNEIITLWLENGMKQCTH